jgi:hypothetical protein
MLRDELLSSVPPASIGPAIPVPTPEWPAFDGKLYCRTVSPAELDRLVAADKKEPGCWRARYAGLVIADVSGNRVFRDDDHCWLAERGVAVIDRFCEAGQRHNGQTEESRTSFLKITPPAAASGSPAS